MSYSPYEGTISYSLNVEEFENPFEESEESTSTESEAVAGPHGRQIQQNDFAVTGVIG